jgi:hypothetical protein
MIKVNLISKKSRAYKGRNWTKTIAYLVFGAFCLYFAGVSLYVVISMNVIKGKIAKVNNESVAISTMMLANNDKLSRFVLTKLILTKITLIEKDRFHYKDYLDQISLLLPNGSVLTNVGFETKGWISVTVSSAEINSFGLLEGSLLNKTSWSDSKYFSGAYIEGVIRDKSGSYSTRLRLELKTQNG